MANLACPRCGTVVTVQPGVAPRCPVCGYPDAPAIATPPTYGAALPVLGKRLSGGAVAGIIVGSLAAFILLVSILFVLVTPSSHDARDHQGLQRVSANLGERNLDADAAKEMVVSVLAFADATSYSDVPFAGTIVVHLERLAADNTTWLPVMTAQRNVTEDDSTYSGVQVILDQPAFVEGATYRALASVTVDGKTYEDYATHVYGSFSYYEGGVV